MAPEPKIRTMGPAVARFFETYLAHSKGFGAGTAFVLEPWQSPDRRGDENHADLTWNNVSMAHEQPASAAVSRQLGWTSIRRAFPLIVLLSTATWLEWDRFRARTPSLIDDWYAIAYSRKALHALLRGDYSSAAVDFSGRYRPSYSAIWNYTQWHLLGSPSVTTAAAWGFVRVVFLIGGLICGLALVGAGVQKILANPGLSRPGMAMAALGYLVYLFGVYSLDDPLPDQDAASGTPWVPVVRLRPPRRLIDPPRLFGTYSA